jgi:hypothetical protein
MATVKIKSSHPSQGDFVVINECAFDSSIHVLFAGEKLPTKETPQPKEKSKRTKPAKASK